MRESPLIDGHNDLAFALRERVGGVRTSTVDLQLTLFSDAPPAT